MFGIGKVLHNVLEQHNLGHVLGELNTETLAGLRQSLEALGDSGQITNVGRLLDDLSGQLSNTLGNAAEEASHLADDVEEAEKSPLAEAVDEVGGSLRDAAASIGATAAAAAATMSAQAVTEPDPVVVPLEAELVPHETAHTLQGVAVEDDGVIATEADAPAAATGTVHAQEAGETADD